MIKTWLSVIAILGLIFSALFFTTIVYKKGFVAGANSERIETLQERNKELGEALEAQKKNTEEATKFDTENTIRTIDNERIVVPRNLVPNANGPADELDEQFLSELAKLR